MNDFTDAAKAMKGGTPAISPFAAAAEQMKSQQAGSVGMALTYDERNPDAAAKSLSVGKELGVNPLVVDSEPEAYDARLQVKRAAEVLKDAPKTAAWLSDMNNGVLAKDDLENASWFERGFINFAKMGDTAATRAVMRGVKRIPLIDEQGRVSSASMKLTDFGRSFDDLVKEEMEQVGGESAPASMRVAAIETARIRFEAVKGLKPEDLQGLVKSGSDALLEARDRMDRISEIKMSAGATRFIEGPFAESETVMEVLGSFADDPLGGAAFVAETAAEFLPALAAASLVTAATRSPGTGAVTMGVASGLTENSMSAMDFLQEQGVQLETPEDAAAVLLNEELMQAARDRGLTRGIVIGMMDAISGGVAGKALMKSPAGDMIAQGIAQVGFGAGGEAMGQAEAGQKLSWKDIIVEGLAELATAPIEVLGVGGRKILKSSIFASKSGAVADALSQAEQMAVNSKLRERSPEAFKSLLDAQGLGDQEIFVPADALREYFQAKDIAIDEETMRAWGVDPMTFDEAAQNGNDVGISMSNFATHIAGTEDAAWLKENATSDPEEMSIATARAFNASVQDIRQEAFYEAEQGRKADEELRAADAQIYDQVFSQLRAAGRSPDVAKNEASVWAAFHRTMGERYKKDPLALAKKMAVDIRGPQTAEPQRRRDSLDISLNTLRTQGAKALKPKGLSLAEFVKAKGGIQDAGGDVAAMEPPKGVVAETAKQVRDRASQPTLDALPTTGAGMSLADMGRMAAEAGYFPDLLGEVNIGAQGEATDLGARLLAALGDDVAGRKVFAEGEGPDAALQALSDALSERGLDPASMTNDEIEAALNRSEASPVSLAEKIASRIRAILPEIADRVRVNVVPVGDPSLANNTVAAETGVDIHADATSSGATITITDKTPLETIVHEFRHVLDLVAVGLGLRDAVKNIESTNEGRDRLHNYLNSARDAGHIPQDVYFSNEAEIANGLVAAFWSDPDGMEAAIPEIFDILFDSRIGEFSFINEMLVEALESTDGQTFNQDGTIKADTPAFSRWFGDSKVVDADGKPLVVYHGTTSEDFESFSNVRRSGKEIGIFFSDDPKISDLYAGYDPDSAFAPESAGRVIPVYLSIKNPLVVDLEGSKYGRVDAINRAKNEGHDGVIIKNNYDAGGVQDQYVAFDPKQIKSVHNRGTFDANDPRILYQADAEFADLKAAKTEAHRLLDEMSNGGDAKAAFAAFGKQADARAKLAEAIASEAGGIELTNDNGLYAAVTKSQAGGDGWRVTTFNDSGFLGHTEHDTKLAAVTQALGEGYTTESEGALREAMKARTFFQKYRQGKRGSIAFPSGGLENGKTVINLFESADLSTFLHETSHAFLEMFTALASTPDAPQQMQDDLATIRKWLGNDGGPITVEQHEKFARGGEAYFMEGNAPSLALADAFSRFKAWLTRIYKTALGLNVKITPEIRDVMDRMLATDAEIAAARQEQEMRPLFSKAPPDMAAGVWETYQRMARRGPEQAEQKLLEKTMAKVRREKESWFREEKKAVYAEVSSEFDRQPRYRLIDMLANQKWIGVDQEIPDMQIDRKMLIEQFGDGVLAEVSRQRLGGKRAIYGDSGSSPEEVAQFFGFGSASEMVSVLQNTQRKKGAIAQEVDRRMTERHGDPLTDGTIEQEALDAIHNEQQANTAVFEARYMAKQLGRSTSGMTVKLYRQRARLMVGRMAVKDVVRPERFLASERKAARAVEDAFAKVAKGGKNSEAAMAAALQAKEQQILNGFLYNEARAVAAEVQKGREKMRAYDKKSVREKLEGGYIEQIDAILSDYDFRVRGQGQINRAESLNAFVERMIAEGREGDLAIDARLMDEAGRKHYTRLSVDELRGLFDTIDNIDHMGRFKQGLKTASRQRMLDESASQVAGQIRAHKKLRKPKDGPRRGLQFVQLFADPDTIAIDLDGGKEFGAVYDELLRDINEGDARAEARQADAGAAIRKIFLNHYTKAEIRTLGKEQNVAGAESWTKEEILTLAMNMGNEDNFQRVMDQRVDQSRRMTPGLLDALLSTLDERDWRFALDMIKEVNGYFGELADVHKRQTGTSLKKVKAKVMTRIAPSWWTGGYYPISFDASVGGRKAEAYAEVTLQKQQTGGFTVANVKKGMTYERQSSAGGQTIRYSLSVPIAHIRDVIRVIELSEAVTATQRILRHDDVVRAFQETGTTEIKESLQLVVDAVANGPQFNNDWMNWAARTLKTNFALAKLGFNLKTVTLQVTGLPQSAVVVGWGNLAKAMAKYFVSPARMASLASEVTSMSDVMNRRRMSFEKDLYEIRNQIETASPVKGRISEGRDIIAQFAMSPITILQFWIVDMPTWLAAYGKFKREGKSDFDAIHFADRLVERSQDSGRMPTRSQIELGSTSKRLQQSDLVRIFTTLGGYMFNKANRMRVEVLRAKYGMQGDASVAAKSAMALGHTANIFIMLTAEAVMMGTLYAWMSDEDDDAEEMLGFVGKEAVGALTGGIPFVRDVYGKSQGFDAGLIGSVAGDVADVYTQTMQWEFDPALVRAYLNLTGDLTGLPTTAISRAVGFAMEPDETSPAEAFFGRNPLNR